MNIIFIMKGMSILKEQDLCNSKEENIKEKATAELKYKKTIGDIDELIFPDDEPHYISQR